MTNPWLNDPDARAASEDAFLAEQADDDGDLSKAKDLYRRAAAAYTRLALSVSADHPQTRSVLGVSAVACHARAGEFGSALDVARRLLAQSGALSERGREDLLRMVGNYSALVAAERKGAKPAPDRQNRMRATVRQVAA